MKMPQLYGNFPQNEVVFFCAADEHYFNIHAKPLINSIRQNFSYPIHFHLYNPSDNTKDFCHNHNISYSFEFFDEKLVSTAFRVHQAPSVDWEMLRRRGKMLAEGDPIEKLHSELVRTYYACARFVRLFELLTKPTYIIMLDADSLVRMFFKLPEKNYDIHIFEKNHRKHVTYTQHLASTIFYTGTQGSFNLIRDHANLIKKEFDVDSFYWFLDQETLDIVIQRYNKKKLNLMYVDFNMDPGSYIWCAKGKRKNNEAWLTEISKYQTL
jgi:hypothetical protein